jgi:hypothetical protein
VFAMLLLLAPQEGGYHCTQPGPIVSCQASDGSIYVEREAGDRVIRTGKKADGVTWTESILLEGRGTRTYGSDSRGRKWFQVCTPSSGTRGTDRGGNSVYFPPTRANPASETTGREGSVDDANGRYALQVYDWVPCISAGSSRDADAASRYTPIPRGSSRPDQR